eukprot:gene44579-biopygen37920
MILFNNIIAPFLATAFVSSTCFYNVYAAPPDVATSYTYIGCPRDERLDVLAIRSSAALDDLQAALHVQLPVQLDLRYDLRADFRVYVDDCGVHRAAGTVHCGVDAGQT